MLPYSMLRPQYRCPAKNQSRSRRIGPPSVALSIKKHIDAVRCQQASRLQIVAEVVALELAGGQVAEQRAAEKVATLFRNDVGTNPTAARFDGNRTRLVDDLFDERVVQLQRGVAVGVDVVQARNLEE